ncbi:lipid-A-disaccharide synthase [Sulfurospirillum sp. 1612]|uniref:lipid-A-disaccharide synthase n=1 Tax=Sulfurospirillum sp. 1612 TaxID=3094835 RepID=UPI002F9499B2
MKLLVSALEPSANLHLTPILDALKEYELFGIFDERLGTPYLPSSAFSIMGFLDVIPKIKKAKKAIKALVKLSFEVDKVLLIDSPAFNLPLAKAIKEQNPKVEIIYYILPQVWAWKAKRVAKVEKYCDVLASVLPFERRFYNRATFVGHPLIDEIKEQKQEYKKTGVLCFLPGSRKSEIRALMPIFREVIKKIDKRAVLVIPEFFTQEKIEELYGDISAFEISRDAKEAFLQSEFAFVCSGTATLEAALIGTPFVLAYKAKKLDYMIAKKFVKLKHVGLANILLDFEGFAPLHEELLQEEVCVEKLLQVYHDTNREQFFQQALVLRKILYKGARNDMLAIITKKKNDEEI